jgi:hypothetical protein
VRKPFPRWHIRIVIQSRERMYLNLLQRRSGLQPRITAQVAAKLCRKDTGERHMHLVGVSSKEVSILVHTVRVIDRVVPGGPLLSSKDWPDMILSEEDALRINEILLTWWKTKEDHFKSWASQGLRTGRIIQLIQDEW